MQKINVLKKSVFILCIMGILAGLAAYAYMGLHIRLIGDDYCEAAILTKYGFINGQLQAFFNPVPFHGNRYTKTFMALFFSLFHPKINGYIPIAMLVIFSIGIYCIQSSFSKLIHRKISPLFKIFISLTIVFFSFLLTPTVNQSLYWRSSMLPSTAPIFVTLFLLSLLIKQSKGSWIEFFLIYLFSFVIGGLSENGILFQLSAVSILFLIFWFLKTNNNFYKVSIKKTFAAFIGSIFSLISMWLSPSIAQEQSEMTISIVETFKLSLSHTIGFYSGFIKSFYVAIIALVIIGFLTYLLNNINSSDDKRINSIYWKRWGGVVIFSQIVVFLLIFSNMIPSAFTRNSYPDPRHLIISTFSSVTGFILLGCLFAELGIFFLYRFGLKNNFSIIVGISVCLFIVSVYYPIRYIPNISLNQRKFRYWSYQWDKRDSEIKRLTTSGENVIHVMRLDSIIEGVGEISPDPNHWYNLCAADFYGISRINADLPGWDEEWSNFD